MEPFKDLDALKYLLLLLLRLFVDVISYSLLSACFRLLFVICAFLVCSNVVSVIGRMSVVPAHKK
jgi:hypothetical protein